MSKVDPRSLRNALKAVLKQPTTAPKPKSDDKTNPVEEIIGRRDERGIPYRGDFPNPASDRTRGCF